MLDAQGRITEADDAIAALAESHHPKIETYDDLLYLILHGILPYRFVDHTHADAVLSVSNAPDGEKRVRDIYGDKVAMIPYVMPGFALAKKTNEISRANPDVEGLILLKHGIFTMGATAEEAYVRMIDLVTMAEQRLAKAERWEDIGIGAGISVVTIGSTVDASIGAATISGVLPSDWRSTW